MPTTELLTTAQAAERAGVTIRTIHRWAMSGRLSHTLKLPGSTGAYLFHPAAVDLAAAGSRQDRAS